MENTEKTAGEPATKSSTQSFADLKQKFSAHAFRSDKETFLNEEDYVAKSKSKPINNDDNRTVIIKEAINDKAIVKMRQEVKGQGILIESVYLEEAFCDTDWAEVSHGTQVGLMLANGKIIYGFSRLSKNKRDMFIPKRLVPKGFPWPSANKRMPIAVLKLIIG